MIEYLININSSKSVDVTPEETSLTVENIELGRYNFLVTPKSIWYNGATYVTGYRDSSTNNAACVLKYENGNIEYAFVGSVDNADVDQHARPAILIIDGYIYILQVNGHGEDIKIYKSNATESINDGFTLHHTITGEFGYLNARYIDGRIVITTRDTTITTSKYSLIMTYSDVGDFTTFTTKRITDADYANRDTRHYPAHVEYYGNNVWKYFIINHRSDITSGGATYFAHSILKTKDYSTYYNIDETFSKNIDSSNYITVDELEDNYTIVGSVKAFNKRVDGTNYIAINDVIYGSYFDYDSAQYKLLKITNAGVQKKAYNMAGFGSGVGGTTGTNLFLWFNGNNIVALAAANKMYALDLNLETQEFRTQIVIPSGYGFYALDMPTNYNEVTGEYIIGGANSDGTDKEGYFPFFITSDKFLLPEVDDTPSDISDLAIDTVFSNSFEISWSASTSTYGIGNYEVYVDGILHGRTTDVSYTVDGLTTSRDYDIRVKAVSVSGTKSNFSNTAIDATAYNIPTGNIVAYYPLDSDSTDAVGTYDGTDTSVNYVNSITNGCANFTSSTSSKIQVADDDSLSFGNGTTDSAFSWSFWAMWSITPATTVFINKKSTSTGNDAEYQIAWNGTALEFYCFDNTATNRINILCTQSFSVSTWYHITATYDGSGSNTGMEIYVDGNLITPTRTGLGTYVAMENETSPLIFGKNANSTTRSFNGYMDEIALFDKELSLTEVNELFGYSGSSLDDGNLTTVANIVSYWKLDGDSTDAIGSNDGTDTSMKYSPSGIIDKYADFSVSNSSKIVISDDDAFSFGNGSTDSPFSWTFWFNNNVTTGTGYYINKVAANFTDGQEYYLIDARSSNTLTFYLKDTTNVVTINAQATFDNTILEWYHIALTYDGSGTGDGIEIYINGALATTSHSNDASYVAMSNTAYDVTIGTAPHSTSTALNGYMDEIALFDKELNASEVLDIYNKNVAGLALTE